MDSGFSLANGRLPRVEKSWPACSTIRNRSLPQSNYFERFEVLRDDRLGQPPTRPAEFNERTKRLFHLLNELSELSGLSYLELPCQIRWTQSSNSLNEFTQYYWVNRYSYRTPLANHSANSPSSLTQLTQLILFWKSSNEFIVPRRTWGLTTL